MMLRIGSKARGQRSEFRGQMSDVRFQMSEVRCQNSDICHLSSGFTLIEVMLAVVILALGILGVIGANIALLNALGVSEEYIEAVCLSKEKMTEVEMNELEEEGLTSGVSRGQTRAIRQVFQWEKAVMPSNSKGLNIIKVTVFKKDEPASRKFSLVSYVRNKE